MTLQRTPTAKRSRGRDTLFSDKAEQRRARLGRLAMWIELANFLSANEPIPWEPPKELLASVWRQWCGWKKKNSFNPFSAAEIEANTHGKLTGTYRISTEREIYKLIYIVHLALDEIAYQFEAARARLKHPRSQENELEDDDDAPDDEWQPIILPFFTPLGWLNEEGGIRFDFGSLGQFVKVLEGIEARKIRRCRKCEQLFYAARADKWTCSLKCQAAYRMQEWRKNSRRYAATRKHNQEIGFNAKERISLTASLAPRGEASAKTEISEPSLPNDKGDYVFEDSPIVRLVQHRRIMKRKGR